MRPPARMLPHLPARQPAVRLGAPGWLGGCAGICVPPAGLAQGPAARHESRSRAAVTPAPWEHMPGRCWEPGLLLLLLLAGCCRISCLVDGETNTSSSTPHHLRSPQRTPAPTPPGPAPSPPARPRPWPPPPKHQQMRKEPKANLRGHCGVSWGLARYLPPAPRAGPSRRHAQWRR